MADTSERAIQGQLPMYETGNQQLDRYQRLDTLPRLEDGFLPVSLEEQSSVMAVKAFEHHPAGAAKHLHEVHIHQFSANTNDPLRAVRKKTRMFGAYALDARDALGGLEDLHQSLRDVLNPELRIDRVLEPTDRGLLPFLRFFDLMSLRQTARPDKMLYDPQKVTYTPDNGALTQVYLPMAMESWRVQQVRRRLPEALQNEGNRRGFWVQRLVEIQKHSPKEASAVAAEELDKIHGHKAS